MKLRLFSREFSEFWSNWEEIRPKGVVGYGFRLGPDGRVDADQDLHVSRFRLKGFLADYRKFHMQKERTSFLGICNILGRRCNSVKFREILEKSRKNWREPITPVVGWHNNYTPDDFIDAYFNDSVFHADGVKIHADGVNKRTLRYFEIQEKLSGKAVLFGAYFIAWHRLLVIRNVNWLIEPYLRGEGVFRIPVDSFAAESTLTLE